MNNHKRSACAILLGILLSIPPTISGVPNLTPAWPTCAAPDLPILLLETVEDHNSTFNIGQGTAFLVKQNIWITAAHLVNPTIDASSTIHLSLRVSSTESIPAKLLYVNTDTDIAIIEAQSNSRTPIKIHDGAIVPQGTEIWTIGYPGFGGGVLQGYSGKLAGNTISGMLTSSSYVNTGMSGGPGLICSDDGIVVALGVIHGLLLSVDQLQIDNDNGIQILKYNTVSGDSLIVPNIQYYLNNI